MGWGRKKQTPAVYAERGYTYTGRGYNTSPVQIHPDDLYQPGRLPNQPFYNAVQGAQKFNAASVLAAASVHVGFPPTIGNPNGALYSPYSQNPMQATGLYPTNGAQKVPSGVGTMGPGTPWAPNPTVPTAQYAGGIQQQPGLIAAIRSKLGV